jgi:hypothetical protein
VPFLPGGDGMHVSARELRSGSALPGIGSSQCVIDDRLRLVDYMLQVIDSAKAYTIDLVDI